MKENSEDRFIELLLLYIKQCCFNAKRATNVALFLSGYQDSNLGPPGPKPGALTGLRYTPITISFSD